MTKEQILRDAVAKFIKAKGRFHTEQNYAALVKVFDATDGATGAADAPEPHGYAYRYPDGIRFNSGIRVNGCDPSESIPYYFGAPPSPTPAAEDVTGASWCPGCHAHESDIWAAHNQAIEKAAALCDKKYHARAQSGHPREAAASRALSEEIRALKSAPAPALPVVATSAMACSSCYGSGIDVAGKPCACGCQHAIWHANSVLAKTRTTTDLSIPAPAINTSGERVEAVGTGPRLIADAECVQSKCACVTTGCWGECQMRRNPVVIANGQQNAAWSPDRPTWAQMGAKAPIIRAYNCIINGVEFGSEEDNPSGKSTDPAEYRKQVEAHLNAWIAGRYEYVRRLHPHEFADLVARNIAGEGKFDDLVDTARLSEIVVVMGSSNAKYPDWHLAEQELRKRQAAYGGACMELGRIEAINAKGNK